MNSSHALFTLLPTKILANTPAPDIPNNILKHPLYLHFELFQ